MNLCFISFLVLIFFLKIGKFTYNNVKPDFIFLNLTHSSISLLQDQLFLIFSNFQSDMFCQEIILIIYIIRNNACTVKYFFNLF